MKLNKINNLQINFINQLIKNFKKEEFIPSVKDNFGGADLVDMQLISNCNEGISFYYVLWIFL